MFEKVFNQQLFEAVKRSRFNSYLPTSRPLNLNLQLFGDDNNNGSQEPNPSENGGNEDGDDHGDKKPQPKYTDEDLDRIIKEKKAKWKRQADEQAEEAKKLAKMNAQQKAEHERDKIQKELDELRAEKARIDMTKEARKMCSEANVNVSDEILSCIITEDADSTKKAVESFISIWNSELEKAVKEALKGNSFKRGTGSSGVTKDDIMKVKDPIERQRLIRENMNLFK